MTPWCMKRNSLSSTSSSLSDHKAPITGSAAIERARERDMRLGERDMSERREGRKQRENTDSKKAPLLGSLLCCCCCWFVLVGFRVSCVAAAASLHLSLLALSARPHTRSLALSLLLPFDAARVAAASSLPLVSPTRCSLSLPLYRAPPTVAVRLAPRVKPATRNR